MLRRLFTSLLPGTRARSEEAILVMSRDLLKRNQAQQVVDLVSPMIVRNPDHVGALCVRGEAWLELHNLIEARRDLERAAGRSGKDPRIQYTLGLSYWIEGNVPKTVQHCRAALALADFEPAHLLLSKIELEGENYRQLLKRIHRHLHPRTYVEIGVSTGTTLKLCDEATQAIGVDPAPRLQFALAANQHVFSQTSDDFFAQHDVTGELGGKPVDLAFIDGMHLFEYALRDFSNLERLCTPHSTILVHDCYPLDRQTADRERTTLFWSGDIWRLILLLKKYRPDLEINVIAAPPTGLGVIRNLDPASRVIADNLARICAEFLALDYSALADSKRERLNLFPNDWERIRSMLDSRGRR